MPGMREVERNIKEFAQTDTGVFTNYDQIRERDEANGLLRNSGIMHNSERLAKMERELEETGVLPRVAFREAKNLDANDDKKITYDELKQITDNPDNYAPTVVLAAREAEKHWQELDAKGRGYITENDLGNFSRKAKSERTADPDQMFGKYGDASTVEQDNEADARENAARANPEENNGAPDERNSRNEGEQPAGEDPTIRHAKKGQGLWDIAKEACPEGATNAEIARMWKAIMEENNMNRKSRLIEGQEIKLPDIYPAAPAGEGPNID